MFSYGLNVWIYNNFCYEVSISKDHMKSILKDLKAYNCKISLCKDMEYPGYAIFIGDYELFSAHLD